MSDVEQLRARLIRLFTETRARTERLTWPLSPEDQQLQSMPSCSPTKWHLGHTTWFFETFVLEPLGVRPFDAHYKYLFNSYYEAIGPRHARPKRGLLSRPSVAEVNAYRSHIDGRILDLLASCDEQALCERMAEIIAVGVAHEEQHQELLLTDILNAFGESPLKPLYAPSRVAQSSRAGPIEPARFLPFDGGNKAIGAPAHGFAFDNERPRHTIWVEPFALADRLVTVGEVRAFIDEGGYGKPSLWLSDGLEFIRTHQIEAPLYASYRDGEYRVYSLCGERVARDDEPVCHISYYEADAIARFLGARLPTEAEWEIAAQAAPLEGNFIDTGALRPMPPGQGAGPRQIFGDAWEWTRSAYEPYAGYSEFEGPLSEYNGKFMVGQQVLRGGSYLSPRRHLRPSYRNFWPVETRFQATGVRLARDA